ncbi:MAG: hypothetical protein LUH23_07135 [Oscillospiraceae bacterium]|nr:hypothetical protein [Oscillospiraceae bacterium]
MSNIFMTAQEVADELNISKSQGYKVIRMLNKELNAKNIITFSGHVSRQYFIERTSYPRIGEERN